MSSLENKSEAMNHFIPCTSIWVAIITTGTAGAAEPVSFTRDVRPILSNNCYTCHGPDDAARITDVRLDTREGLFSRAGEITPVVPHQLKASELYRRITSNDDDERMPPPDSHKTLSETEKETLRRWIKQGARWESHWSFGPIARPSLPRVKNSDWANNAIDLFILAHQQRQRLTPSPRAEGYTLIRRLYLDLVGLPPTPEDADRWHDDIFKDDEFDANAYARLVDELIASDQYGERWARHWLDLARYADTNGYEKDRDRPMWPFRDWVIQAINDGTPFDQFTIEQVAGDMLENATASQRIATGFHRNTMLNEEGGIDPLEFRFYAMTDRVSTTGTTWLGLTTGCAQCHTHKFDPISHRQYYELMALMDNTDEPELDVPDASIDQQVSANRARAAVLLAELPGKWPGDKPGFDMDERFHQWLSAERDRARNWTTITPHRMTTNLPLLQLETEGILFASGDSSKHDIYELEFNVTRSGVTALRLEALPDARLPSRGPGMTNYEGTIGDFFLSEFLLWKDGSHVAFKEAVHSYAKNRYGNKETSARLMIDGDIQTGWSVHQGQGQRHVAVMVPEKPIAAGTWKLVMHFGRHFSSSLGKFRLSVATDNKPAVARELPPTAENLLAYPPEKLDDHQLQLLRDEFLLSAPELKEHAEQIKKLRVQLPYQRALVMKERPVENPRTTHIHHRGEYLQTGQSVTPSALDFLHPFEGAHPADRLGLARWLVSADNPLTPRVVANRQWAAFFGRGIVATVDDFGFQGEPPTHPELLDHLATKLLDHGWSTKWLHKYIVRSATYQQASSIRPGLLEVDPGNTWLTRYPRTRLEAEVIRDASLQSAGILSSTMFGPPVRPPQPDGTTSTAYGSPKWTASEGEDRYRRSIYTYMKRTAPFAMLSTFDAPSGESCIPRRDRSNTALQALTLMNDVMFMEIAARMGSDLAEMEMDTGPTAQMAFRRILTRPPSVDELSAIVDFYQKQYDRFTSNPESARQVAGADARQPIESAAWAMVVRALFSTDETVTRN
ncbi:MAG: PSD1 and planctomycete cytochrome C domain-containing protein [Planctomycetota bacterium]|nr:PSD1 and planctomycete cytochrome C domain-containing protein [Planctomycetota bacterium]